MTTSPSVLPSFKLVEIAFSSAIRIVDKQYGKGYALKNPQLIASLSQIILDNSSTDSGVSPYPTGSAPDILGMIYLDYSDYENKILSQEGLLYKLRDYYYIAITGSDYENWLEDRDS